MFEFVVPKFLRNGRDAIRFGQSGIFIGSAELRIVTSVSKNLGDCGCIESSGVGKAGATIFDDSNADAFTLRRDKMLDCAFIDTNGGLAAATDIGLNLFIVAGLRHHSIGNRL